jgi:hypothetical protein
LQKKDTVTKPEDDSSLRIPNTESETGPVNEPDDYVGCIFEVEPQATPDEDWREYL